MSTSKYDLFRILLEPLKLIDIKHLATLTYQFVFDNLILLFLNTCSNKRLAEQDVEQ